MVTNRRILQLLTLVIFFVTAFVDDGVAQRRRSANLLVAWDSLGVGTGAPAGMLHIQPDSSGGHVRLFFVEDTTGQAGNDIDTVFVITADGKVAIKTAAPQHLFSSYTSNPVWALTDSDVNTNVSSAAQAIDTSAVAIDVSGEPTIKFTASDGDAWEITSNTSDYMVIENAAGYLFEDGDTLIIKKAAGTTEMVTLRLANTTAQSAVEIVMSENALPTEDGMKIRYDGTSAGGNVLQFMGYQGGGGPTARVTIQRQGGMIIGAPTGGDKGAGTLNATAVYDDNVLLGPDFVFEEDYNELSIADTRDYYEKNKHLPTMPKASENIGETRKSIGEIVMALWETVEIQQKHISELQQQIYELKGRRE